jgi:hypothetical protein
MYSNQSLAKFSDLASTDAEIYTSTQIYFREYLVLRGDYCHGLSPLDPKIRCILDFSGGMEKVIHSKKENFNFALKK